MLVHKPHNSLKVEVYHHFTHDCDECTYLGSAEVNTLQVDFYVHDRKGENSRRAVELIYRTGSDGGEYGCVTIDCVTPLNLLGSMALGLYVMHLEANGASGQWTGSLSKDDQVVLNLK